MSLYISVFSLVFVLNFLGFLLAYFFKTDKLTDLMYSLSFICATILLLLFFSDFSTFQLILAGMVLLWSLRLGGFLFIRIHKMGKDDRFDKMRASFVKFGAFWLLQAISVYILIIPVLILFIKETLAIGIFQYIGISIFLIGLFIEGLADFQKDKFKSKNPGELYISGLYKYVRYPNYTGEIMVWIGIWLMGVGHYDTVQFLSIGSPIWIFILLRYISGIPLIEKQRGKRYKRNPEYLKYLKKTPRLIPIKL